MIDRESTVADGIATWNKHRNSSSGDQMKARKLLALFLSCAVFAYAEGNTFSKVRYNGGSVPSKVDPKDWPLAHSLTT